MLQRQRGNHGEHAMDDDDEHVPAGPKFISLHTHIHTCVRTHARMHIHTYICTHMCMLQRQRGNHGEHAMDHDDEHVPAGHKRIYIHTYTLHALAHIYVCYRDSEGITVNTRGTMTTSMCQVAPSFVRLCTHIYVHALAHTYTCTHIYVCYRDSEGTTANTQWTMTASMCQQAQSLFLCTHTHTCVCKHACTYIYTYMHT